MVVPEAVVSAVAYPWPPLLREVQQAVRLGLLAAAKQAAALQAEPTMAPLTELPPPLATADDNYHYKTYWNLWQSQ